MTNRELRSYIRKEIVLNESQYDFSSSDLSKVWDSFTAVFKTTGLALKAIASALVLNFRIVFAVDESEVKKAFRDYEGRSNSISAEYDKVLGPARERLNDLKPLLFLAAPGAYIANAVVEKGPTFWPEAKTFFREIGIDISEDPGPEGAGGKSPGSRSERDIAKDMRAQQSAIQSRLDAIFGLVQQRVDESVILNEANDDKQIDAIASSMIQKFKNSSLGIDKKALQSVIDLKKKQSDEYVRIINAPVSFLKKLSAAKTLEEVKGAVTLLKGAPFTLGGIEDITPKNLEDSAVKALKTAIEKKKLEALFKEIGVEAPEDEKQRIEAIKAYQLRNLLGTTVVNARESILSQTEILRKLYLEKFEEDVPLDILKKIAPDSELERVVSAGLEKIKNAGKQQQ